MYVISKSSLITALKFDGTRVSKEQIEQQLPELKTFICNTSSDALSVIEWKIETQDGIKQVYPNYYICWQSPERINIVSEEFLHDVATKVEVIPWT